MRIRQAMTVICLLATGTQLPDTSHAQAQESDPELPRYEVELIVFRHLDQSQNTPEVALPQIAQPDPIDDPLPSDRPNLAADEANTEFSDTQSPESLEPIEMMPETVIFTPLTDESATMDPIYARLLKLDAYEPLTQLGWSQQALNRADALAYEVPAVVTDTTGVSGAVTLYKERYLHLKLELNFNEGLVEASEDGSRAYTQSNTFTLKESRRIRGTNAHYFDHPEFGVIASIRKEQTAEKPQTQAND
jgi:hypothetical protein